MSNLQDVRPVVKTVDLGDGVQREVKFTLNALAELEEKYGSMQAAFNKIENEQSVSAIRFLIHVAIRPQLSEAEIGELIDFSTIGGTLEQIFRALNAQMPQDPAPKEVPLSLDQVVTQTTLRESLSSTETPQIPGIGSTSSSPDVPGFTFV